MKIFKSMLVSRIFSAFFTLFMMCVLDVESVRYFKIGGIFDESHYDAQMAFQYGIDRINMHSHKIKFEPVIRNIRESDSFHAEKMACELLDNDVVGIFGPDSSDARGIVRSIAATFEIPHIETTWRSVPDVPEESANSFSINFYPDEVEVARAWADLIKDYDWKSYSVLYEDDEGLMRLSKILRKHGPGSTPVTVRMLEPDGDNQPIFKAIRNASESRIIMDCAPDNVLKYFRQANKVNLMGDYQSYVLTNIDSHTADLGEFRYGRTNVTSLRMVEPTSASVRNAVSDWEEGEKMKERHLQKLVMPNEVKLRAALLNDALRHFTTTFIDLDRTKNITPPSVSCKRDDTWEHGLGIVSFMTLKQTNGMTGLVAFTDGKRNDFNLDIVELSKEGFNKIGMWSPGAGIQYARTESEVQSTLSEKWKNKTFIVSSRIGAPYLTNRQAAEGEVLVGNQRYEGYAMDLIHAIAQHLNLTYEFRLVPDGNYGSLDKATGKWNGLILELLENRADLAICDLTITSERKSAVDFTMPFMTLGISILYSKTIKEPPKLFSFMSPLAFDVWIYMATAYLSVSMLMFVLSRIEPGNWESAQLPDEDETVLTNVWNLFNTFWFSMSSLMGAGCDILPKMAPKEWANPHPCNNNPEELENQLNILNSLWFAMGSFLQQGSDILPKAVATRVVAGMWWFFTLIMISSYTANLAAFLTNERSNAAINSAEDLAKQNKIKYGVVGGGSTGNFFKNSNFSTYKQMWTNMESTKPSVFVKSNDEGIDRVSNGKGKYAFIMESVAIEHTVARKCDLQQIGGMLDSKGYGIAMPPNSPYRTAISGAVLKLQEEGKLLQLKKTWWTKGGICGDTDEKKESDDSAADLGMDNVGGVFVVLGGGCILSFLVALAEFLWSVSGVAVEEKITFTEAFMAELKFALNIWVTTKPVHNRLSESNSSRSSRSSSKTREPSEARGSAGNALQAATSFMRLDKVF